MTIPDHISRTSVNYHETPSCQMIREWRDSFEMFFTENWGKVREIILSLEESLWEEDSSPEENVQQQSTSNKSNQRLMESTGSRTSRVPASSDPGQKERLESLAKNIETRLDVRQR